MGLTVVYAFVHPEMGLTVVYAFVHTEMRLTAVYFDTLLFLYCVSMKIKLAKLLHTHVLSHYQILYGWILFLFCMDARISNISEVSVVVMMMMMTMVMMMMMMTMDDDADDDDDNG